MRLIDRYLLRQLLGPTVYATLALTAVALLSTSLSQLDIIVSQRQSALVFLQVTLLAMPQLVNMVMPIALLVAALVALNRLHVEQEIVVCFAGGMSRWRVIAPALRLAGVVTLIALFMNLWVQPAASRQMRETLFQVRTDLASTLVREGEFTEPAPGLTVYAQSVDSGGLIHNLFIHQTKSDGGATTYTADEGRVVKRGDKPVLLMRKGSNQEFSRTGVLNFLSFDEYVFDLSRYLQSNEMVHYKPSDRYLHELLFPDLQQVWETQNRDKLLAEGAARLSTPLYNLTFMSFALLAIIGGGFSRLGYGRRIATVAGLAVAVRILGFVVQAGSESEPWLNLVQFVVPLGAMALALRGIFKQRVSRFIDMRQRPARIAQAPA
ncbi:LPS export ABC transporter permease LptF [Phenylobacterium sp.]|uniref:LPS export ABC transporter permease LptF n=1 Tax=Phenylobacterium sp. TaxID=1871053 RepID=UPI002727E205|nr:LPS export ABC transporter permease LptF [Phenylobacterium sp.]MDO8377439.1 LPS export ABC transporter permease LptF [Phenylobacterium sp.]